LWLIQEAAGLYQRAAAPADKGGGKGESRKEGRDEKSVYIFHR
jgi:hypothetical protein